MTDPPPAKITARAFMDPAALDAETTFFVRYLDVLHATAAVRASHQREVALLGVREGFSLLDAGCGPGNVTRELAALVGPTGRVVGVDLSPALLGVAQHRVAGVDLPVEFHVADIQALPFADATFDGARCERVLQYLADPARALVELARVTKPGGTIVASEVDWDTIVVDAPDIDRDSFRRAIHAISDGAGNGWMGRQLRRYFLDLGLEEVSCEGFALILTDAPTVLDEIGGRVSTERVRDAGVIRAEECERLIAASEAAGRADRYFYSYTFFVVSGRTPRGN
jgi:ubiquinone/menaquinone biosynthesis C-methylase UbiE